MDGIVGMNGKKVKMVIVVRSDLQMTTGKIVSQACHAVTHLIETNGERPPGDWVIYDQWTETGQKTVTLACPSLENMNTIQEKCDELKVPHVVIQDAGLTQVPAGTVTVMGIGPMTEQVAKKITGYLRLYE